MFRPVDVRLLHKVDLLPHLDLDVALFDRHLRTTNPNATVIPVSACTGDGLDGWGAWLTGHVPWKS